MGEAGGKIDGGCGGAVCVEWRRGVISMGVGVKGRIKR